MLFWSTSALLEYSVTEGGGGGGGGGGVSLEAVSQGARTVADVNNSPYVLP